MTGGAKCGKAMLLANAGIDRPRKEFETFFLGDVGSSVARKNAVASKCVLMDPHEISGLPHQVLMADSPPPFHVVYQLRSPDPHGLAMLGDGIQEVAEQLNDWIDHGSSALVVGTEVCITLGSGPIEIIMPLRRRRELSHDDFMQSWFVRHATLADEVEGVRYRQNHVDVDATNRLSRATGLTLKEIDGITEAFFLTPEEASEFMSQPHVAYEAIEDEKTFIDHSRSQFGFYRAGQ